MHTVLNHFKNLVFLLIINNFLLTLSYSQQNTYSRQDSILINYINTWTGKEIRYIKNNKVKNIIDFNLGPLLYDTVWYKIEDESYEITDSTGITDIFETFIGYSYNKRTVAFQRFNQTFYIGFTINIFAEIDEEYMPQISFFVFNSKARRIYKFISGPNIIAENNINLKQVLERTSRCNVFNKHYKWSEIIIFNKRIPYRESWGYFSVKSKYITYEKYITLFKKRIKVFEIKKNKEYICIVVRK